MEWETNFKRNFLMNNENKCSSITRSQMDLTKSRLNNIKAKAQITDS